ncbi:type I-E CRISPR-associated protein Cas7/Cse4/CasC [bacterium]|nr:type I-E CRISPR-associated protein Cas7/Cse4/CasC [bacterium]
MLIEMHILQNHAPSNLNRDDLGSPKSCIFGDVRRARISSQCIKRSIRRSTMFQEALSSGLATRTRKLPVRVGDKIRERLQQEQIGDEKLIEELVEIAVKKATGFGTESGKEQPNQRTAQTMFLTPADIDQVADVIYAALKEAEFDSKKCNKISAKDLQKQVADRGFRPVTVDIALFGRMTTSPAFHDIQASTQVAHALSTHKVDPEFDYYTAVDDLQRKDEEEEMGADMIGDIEFNSACYYKYLSLDVDGLVNNLTGRSIGRKGDIPNDEESEARDLAAQAVNTLLLAAAMVSPTGKQNSFAAHNLPSAILVEVRDRKVPVSYANAFVVPVPGKGNGLVQNSVDSFLQHVQEITRKFNLDAPHRFLFTNGVSLKGLNGFEIPDDLNSLVDRVESLVRSGEAAHA